MSSTNGWPHRNQGWVINMLLLPTVPIMETNIRSHRVLVALLSPTDNTGAKPAVLIRPTDVSVTIAVSNFKASEDSEEFETGGYEDPCGEAVWIDGPDMISAYLPEPPPFSPVTGNH